jgi:acetyl-CoA C-acetyltransferase
MFKNLKSSWGLLMEHIVITSATRTPIGSFNGCFSKVAAHYLGATVIKEAIKRSKIESSDISETILGQVLTSGQGQNPARQAHIEANLPIDSPAWSLNQVCGSGLRSVAVGAQHIALGDAKIVVAGGQENMSLSPHFINIRSGKKMGDISFIDSMIKDGLWDAFNGYHMGVTAENIAEQWQITREEQDIFAVKRQNKAENAQKLGKFEQEITPVVVMDNKQCKEVKTDEYIKSKVKLENLSNLRPAFDKNGTVTAGNASGINDGAAVVILMSESEAEKRGLEPLARIASYASVGVDPKIMGIGPVGASKKAIDKAGWRLEDLDLVESNEAFAAQACAVNKEMGWNPEIVNVNGGAIAIGHPIGASGSRILTTLLYEMKRQKLKRGLATLCIGGGMGVALCVERP